MKKYIVISGLISLAFGLIFSFTNQGTAAAADLEIKRTSEAGIITVSSAGKGSQGLNLLAKSGNLPGLETPAAYTTLSETEKMALIQAIEEEYKALNLYNSVLMNFGDVSPFNRIADSEGMHANALARTMNRYGIPVPQNNGLANPPVITNLQDACTAAVDAEKTDAALYDDLMSVTTHGDVIRVYTNLQDSSLNNHLPAFEACQ